MSKPSKSRNSLIMLWQVEVVLKKNERRHYIYAELKRRLLYCQRFRLGALLDEIERRQRRKTAFSFWANLGEVICQHFQFTGIEYYCLFYDRRREWTRVNWREGKVQRVSTPTEAEINHRHRRKGWIQ